MNKKTENYTFPTPPQRGKAGKRLSYKQRLFLYIFGIFTIFTIGVVVLEQTRERTYKTEMLVERLDAYVSMIDAALQHNKAPELIQTLLPEHVRLTLIDYKGKVLYDNVIDDVSQLDQHLERSEIQAAKYDEGAWDIRLSQSTNQEYLYYAKRFPQYFVRVALPYNVQVQHFLKADKGFLYLVLVFFVIMLFVIRYVSGRFGTSIKQLRDFALAAEDKKTTDFIPNFPHDELGEIGEKIAENYKQLQKREKEIVNEREKLLQHVYNSQEGLCFFSKERTVQFYNGLFVQYLNILEVDITDIFTNQLFEKIVAFVVSSTKNENYFEMHISKQGKYFALRVSVFDDKSFEIIINDITKQEKNRLLKQEMTGNIAHELRTPVTSIRGYLETLLQQSLPEEKKRLFIERAYNQTLALSELMYDMSLITKMEEASQSFTKETVNITQLLEELKNDLESFLQEKNISMTWNIPKDAVIEGNRNLLYAIFRNLTDNTIRYAGADVAIHIRQYNEDKDFYYFSFTDTGIGISEEHHLNRLFERFYRINEGRTRDTGGSGLGLSIVKNAVGFHKGTIVAKNRVGGGLEFLFQLHK
ncbi:MAG: HAMP domain-containing histidine kinase [Bacteroidales bacterium]|jgi:signal transduction histidine kinase|nr:HAMP domain-containing histidine kinase [Bacteroidales bacterium]